MAKLRRAFSIEDKKRFVELIDADIEGGMSKEDAYKKHKIGSSQYHAWKQGKAMEREVGPSPKHHARPGGTHTTIDVSSLPPRPTKIKTHNKPYAFTEKQRSKLMARMEKMIAKGMSASDAAIKVGINPSTYYAWHRKPSLLAPLPPKATLPALNGHAKMNGQGAIQIALQVSGISLKVEGHPVEISLQQAIKLQEGLDKMLAHR